MSIEVTKFQTLQIKEHGFTHQFIMCPGESTHVITSERGDKSTHLMTPTEIMLAKLVIAD